MDRQIPSASLKEERCYSCEYYSGNRHMDDTKGCLVCKQKGYCSQKDKGMNCDSYCERYRQWSIILLMSEQTPLQPEDPVVEETKSVDDSNKVINIINDTSKDEQHITIQGPSKPKPVFIVIVFIIMVLGIILSIIFS